MLKSDFWWCPELGEQVEADRLKVLRARLDDIIGAAARPTPRETEC